jgi:hypothetical protein
VQCYENYISRYVSQFFGYFFPRCQLVIIVGKKIVGLHFGLLFRNLIWSPCCRLTRIMYIRRSSKRASFDPYYRISNNLNTFIQPLLTIWYIYKSLPTYVELPVILTEESTTIKHPQTAIASYIHSTSAQFTFYFKLTTTYSRI